MTDVILRTANELVDWLASKHAIGTRVIYHQGFLAEDRGMKEWARTRPDADAITDLAWKKYVEGKVTLTQRRLGPRQYIYYADAT